MMMADLDHADLAMLLARLDWPVPSVRWWAIQEVASLLTSEEFGGQVETALIEKLSATLFETEVTELLFVFWLASRDGYSVPDKLGSAIAARSQLTLLLLHDAGYSGVSQGSLSSPLLLAPSSFSLPDDLVRAEGTEVPRIFGTILRRLEQKSGHPFLAQYAFEWTSLLRRRQAIWLDVSHFYSRTREGVTGQFVSQASHRGRSAYLRVLEIAREYWGLPNRIAADYSLMALPIDPLLAKLRPTRPTWMVQWPQEVKANAEALSTYVRSIVTRFEHENGNQVLGAFSCLIHHSNLEVLDLTVTLWARLSETRIDAQHLAELTLDEAWHNKLHLDGLSTAGWCEPDDSINKLANTGAKTIPVAGRVYPTRHGYLNTEVTSRGIYAPLQIIGDTVVEVRPLDTMLSYSINGVVLGTSQVWNMEWQPYHLRETGPHCGIHLTLLKENLPLLLQNVPKEYLYFWELKKVSRKQEHEPYTSEAIVGMVSME
jgi:hypothetical protein